MDTPMNSETRKILAAVAQGHRPIDPRAAYDGQMFLADRPPLDLEYVKRHVTDPVVIHTDQGLVTQTKAMLTNSNPFYQPTMPYSLTHPNYTNHAEPF